MQFGFHNRFFLCKLDVSISLVFIIKYFCLPFCFSGHFVDRYSDTKNLTAIKEVLFQIFPCRAKMNILNENGALIGVISLNTWYRTRLTSSLVLIYHESISWRAFLTFLVVESILTVIFWVALKLYKSYVSWFSYLNSAVVI